MRTANFAIVEDSQDRVVLKDLGPWDKHPTITNDAEGVVERLAPMLKGRRLFYYDSEGELDELAVDAHLGTFAGFRPGPRYTNNRKGD